MVLPRCPEPEVTGVTPMLPEDALCPPLWTADLPGIGGRIKERPEDFEVEEIPAYEPCGQGEFLYLWVEKRDVGAQFFLREVARRLDLGPNEVGTAGLKDRHAVTRQLVSVPAQAEPRLEHLSGDGIQLLRVSRHGNKLRPGHLRGNRFRILIRDVDAAAAERLGPLLERLRRDGLPNFYGPQRFGRDGETLNMGLALLGRDPGGGGRAPVRNPFLRKLALSAAQSAIFNHYLSCRLRDGLFRRVLAGDVMGRWPFGGMFTAVDVAVEQARFDRRETVHTGPMFGRKMFAAAPPAAEREAAALGAFGLGREAFGAFGKLLAGTRRHNVMYVDDVAAEQKEGAAQLTFTLAAGSYATILLREITKNSVSDDDAQL
jgi:tRNA pseudouridine13 synthase